MGLSITEISCSTILVSELNRKLKREIGIAVSVYFLGEVSILNTDYVLVKAVDYEWAINVLIEAGYTLE